MIRSLILLYIHIDKPVNTSRRNPMMNTRLLKNTVVLIALLIALLAVSPAMADPTIVDSGTCGENVTWTLDDQGLLTISGSGTMYYCSEESTPWYDHHTNIHSVVIEYGVTCIGGCAFYGCTNMTSISIPDCITGIGSDAFTNCSGLTSITIPNSVTSIEYNAFNNCTGLTSITIPDSVTSIGYNAFNNCTGLTSFSIPSGVTCIDSSVFYGCSSLTSVTIPDSVTMIGSYAFYDCSNLKSITFPDIFDIGDYAFHGCRSLTSLTFPDSLSNVGCFAFEGCVNLTSITIPENIYGFEHNAFNLCSNIKEIHLASIGQWLNFEHGSTQLILSGDGDGKLYVGDTLVTSITIPEYTTYIGEAAFLNYASLTSITIPESVTYIADNAFTGADSVTICCYKGSYADTWAAAHNIPSSYLAKIIDRGTCGENATWTLDDQGLLTISGNGAMADYLDYGSPWYDNTDITAAVIQSGITHIGNRAFQNCSNLTDITIPDSVTGIGDEAFSYCQSLTSISIPGSVKSIGMFAFYYCDFNDIHVDSIEQWLSYDHGDSQLFLHSDYGKLYFGNALATSITIPAGITCVRGGAFQNCACLTNVTIPDSITGIGNGAFYGCSSLTSVTLPDSVISIGSNAFADCFHLTSINIPGSVTSIGSCAFFNCYMLKSITIPDGVTSIESGTFCECNLTSVTIPESVISIGNEAFSGCPWLTVYCYEFSCADTWAANNGYPCRYLDNEIVPVSMSLPETYMLPKGKSTVLPISLFPDAEYELVWSSSDPSIVSVNSGTVTGLEKGTATITVICERSDKTTLTASCAVTCYVPLESFSVDPAEAWITAKESCQISLTLVPADSEEEFTYTSSNTTLATVNKTGLVTTKGVGDITFNVSAESGKAQTFLLHSCYPAQSIAFDLEKVPVGDDPVQLQAVVTTKGGSYTNKLVTFTSNNEKVATVDENGMVYPQDKGIATITATASNGITASCEVSVGYNGHFPRVTINAIKPTCTDPGRTAQIICSDCGAILSVSEVIPALEHDLIHHDAQAVTCTAIGWEAYDTCSRCDHSTYVEIPALGHDLTSHEVQAATCTDNGWEAYEACSRCDYSTIVVIPALGHDTVPHEARAVTCTEIGWDAYETCTRCDYSTYVEIPATGHTVVQDAYIPPTRTTWGMSAGSHCSVCNEILTGNEPIEPLSDAPVIIIPTAVIGLGEEAYMGSAVVCVRLPAECSTIGARAFAQCSSLAVIEIPAGCTEIAEDAFDGSPDVTIVTTSGSCAAAYAEQHNIPYLILR